MTPAIQFFLLLTVGQIMMTGSDPVPEPLDELHVHVHVLQDEDNEGSYAEPLDHEENHANNKKLLNKQAAPSSEDSEELNGNNDNGNEENGSGNKLLANKWVMPMPMPMRPVDRF